MKFFWRKLLLAIALIVGVLSPATVSFAHAGLISSEPAASIVRGKIPVLKDGAYVVSWRVTSADGNPVSGAFRFYVRAQQEDVTDLLGNFSHASHADSSGNKLSILLRWIVFCGSIVLIGSLVLMSLISRANELDERSAIVEWGRSCLQQSARQDRSSPTGPTPLAGWYVPTIVVSGVAQAWLMMGGFGALFNTAYG